MSIFLLYEHLISTAYSYARSCEDFHEAACKVPVAKSELKWAQSLTNQGTLNALESYDLFHSNTSASPAFTVSLGPTKILSILHPACRSSALTVISIFIASRIMASFPLSSTSPSLERTFQTLALRGEEIVEIEGSNEKGMS